MDMSMERDSSALGSLFQQIINDMKNTSPLWEDFVAKASKLHACLRAAIQAIASYLDAFQKIADAATNSRGASKEIGTALTRVCLRHKAVETRLKTFTAAIMDCLVQPLQEKLEDWKRSVATIDKEHAKEYKRCRTELKKRSTDTLRLQKKARKGQSDTLQSLMDSHMQDVTLRRAELEEVEKKSLRSAMIEERMRYCNFVHLLQPVVKEECEVMSELGHLQEAMQSIALVTKEPHILPPASEELIHDAKASIALYPESPSASGGGGGSLSQGGCSNSLGSRKSSVCSISSMNSSGSSNSPGHPHYPRSLSQLISPSIRLKPGESSDSGFCSSPALTTQASSIANPSHAVTTWPTHSQDADLASNATDRPHTISTAYEKGHQRPPLTVYTFQNPETIHEGGMGNTNNVGGGSSSGQNTPSTQKSPGGALNRPPLPVKPAHVRCSSLERPLVANNNRGNGPNLMQRQCPSPIPAHVTKELSAHLAQQHLQQQQQAQHQQTMPHNQQQQQSSPPTYVNMSELANMAAMKINNLHQQQQQQQQTSSPSATAPYQQPAMLQQQHSIDSISSIHSNDSNQHHSQQQQSQYQQPQQQQQQQYPNNNQTPSHHPPTTQRSHSSSSMTPSLHSHPSIDSTTMATPPIGQTPTHSSGSSTPQNHYSPLLNNSLSSTAAGTPSGSSIASGGMSLSGGAAGVGGGSGNNSFAYNVCSPTPPLNSNSSQASDILKITENDGMGNNQHHHQQQQQTHHHQSPPNNNRNCSFNNESTAQSASVNANLTSSSSNSSCGNTQEISTPPNSADPDISSGIVVENDERSRASVLQKASMFEKQAAAAKSTPATTTASSSAGGSSSSSAGAGGHARASPAVVDTGIYGTRSSNNTNNHHTTAQQQSQPIDPQDVDKCFEDSLQELNNLIGELDSFQREIDASKEQHTQHHSSHTKNLKNLYDGLDSFNSNETMTIITDDTSTTIICESQQQVHLQHHHQQQQQHQPATDKDFCTASNQTNSSGCGTDISDTTSEDCNADTRSLTSQPGGVVMKTNLKSLSGGAYNSDSELSRCYVSETSSIMGGAGDGYENPTFAHFAVSSTSGSQCYDDNRSDTISLQRHGIYSDNISDSGSNVVVIYDHQPPMTPDIDYAKQNSEIVMLRTKPQQYPMGGQIEMRELQQLPSNLTELPTSPNDSPEHVHSHVATVQPAKQRLSSFRASSEQLQLLHTSTATTKGMHSNHLSNNRNSCGGNTKVSGHGDNSSTSVSPTTTAVMVSPNGHQTPSSNGDVSILRKKLPPKPPSLSVFQGNCNSQATNNVDINNGNGNNNRRSLKLVAPPPTSGIQIDFKSDLEAKILKQKEKLKKLQQQQQQGQPQQQQEQESKTTLQTGTTTTKSPPPPPPQKISCPGNVNHQYMANSKHHHSINSTTSKASSVPPPSTSSSTSSSYSKPSLNVVMPPLPPPLPPSQHNHHHNRQDSASTSSSMLCNTTNITSSQSPSMLATIAKPNITPRPASLSSGSTRIARRSSVNTAKPPPPVRRSSSVTPSPNTPTTPPKQYHHQYTKSSPVLLSPTTTKKSRTPTPPTPPSPQTHFITDLDATTPPPLPPPNPNHHYPTTNQQQQQSHQLRYQQQQSQQQQQLMNNQQNLQQQDKDYYNNGETIYGANSPTSFRTSSPGGIYAQPKILNSMSSFRNASPGPNGHQTPTQSHVPAQPKTNPNLIAQLNARLNSKQQTNSGNEAIYGVSQPQSRDRNEDIYMRNYGQQHQMSPHASQQQQQQTYDAAETNANANSFNTNQNQYNSSSQYYAPKHITAAANHHHHQHHQSQTAVNHQQMSQRQPMSQSPQAPAQQQTASHYQSGGHHHSQQQHYTCPPPLEDPPPPPIHSNNNSATMPKRGSNHHNQQHPTPSSNLASYAAASSTSTLPRNLIHQQQRLQQQGHYGTTQSVQQQQYHAPGAISAGHQQAQSPHNISQRPPMPLPQQQQQQPPTATVASNRQRTSSSSTSSSLKQQQPPIPSRHSSVQQKIFVATNPFIQTTTIHCQSPSGTSSVHSQPASPICNSPTPSSVASIYGTSRRSSGSTGGGGGISGGSHYDGMGGNGGSMYSMYNHHHQQQSSSNNTNYTSTNVDKSGITRAKAKAEFLENLNQKLAKQSLSGRAFAVRNLINSKALMYQNTQNLKRPSAQYRNLPLFDTHQSSTATMYDEAL
ncbi:missing-in-metastasis isoform X10 [Haematobia irritans]|uniref:missing-in-metastasis isoform X10 n=1 Tax=Haematobia irritans TaxID=7368 RepID=UPI003F4FEB0A